MFEKEEKSTSKIISELKQNGIRFVYLQFTDVLGIVKSVAIPVDQFSDCIERGKWFDGSSVEGLARVLESDMYLKPDLRTLTMLPWEDDGQPAARLICWVFTPDGRALFRRPAQRTQTCRGRSRRCRLSLPRGSGAGILSLRAAGKRQNAVPSAGCRRLFRPLHRPIGLGAQGNGMAAPGDGDPGGNQPSRAGHRAA